ncbi:unnamed protein product [Rotaria sordida]|uniref:RING-type domain-containing protein n=1 Tax=Rotaria sordida TaxID=392033 RepID=A0A814MRN0_9BILA|nr:unnamed protein product [Rotaria sordida]CAF1080287.1 unnamed protein product [Rotaria sordida]CAF1081591.1 unnamed protein product [Rotaria sordida]CAF1095102.1 unnamed protein product [Rotaria sordida]CAF1222456.1 unnamed protein product [Rotaria sordida]
MASNGTSSNFSNNTTETTSKNKDDLLSEILTCGICLSRMSSPCCLPCAHSFCRSCLLDYAQNNNINALTPINYILCPYCKFQLNFRSFEHFESILIINPTLKQLCEALDASVLNSDQSQYQTNGNYRARCHTCCLLKMLKVCKHCFFMLCETCRRTHLLDVHRESKIQLDILDLRLRLINEKRFQMDKITEKYDDMRQHIKNYVERLICEIEQQRDHALHIINDRQQSNDDVFWTGNGFDNSEKLDFFISLFETGQKKLTAKNITDKELMELYDNLQTIPDVNEDIIESIDFTQLSLELDETFPMKQFIRVYDNDISSTMTTDSFEKSTNNNEQTECIQT